MRSIPQLLKWKPPRLTTRFRVDLFFNSPGVRKYVSLVKCPKGLRHQIHNWIYQKVKEREKGCRLPGKVPWGATAPGWQFGLWYIYKKNYYLTGKVPKGATAPDWQFTRQRFLKIGVTFPISHSGWVNGYSTLKNLRTNLFIIFFWQLNPSCNVDVKPKKKTSKPRQNPIEKRVQNQKKTWAC